MDFLPGPQATKPFQVMLIMKSMSINALMRKRVADLFPLANRKVGFISIQNDPINGAAVVRVGDATVRANTITPNCGTALYAGQQWPPFAACMNLEDIWVVADTDSTMVNFTIGLVP